ncbi:MAG: hypothetical protein ACFFCQ_12305 [Promethearchaeota archaeon]
MITEVDYNHLAKILAEHSRILGVLSKPRYWQYLLVLFHQTEQNESDPYWKGLTMNEIVAELDQKKYVQNLYRDFKSLYKAGFVNKDQLRASRVDTVVYRLSNLAKQFIEEVIQNSDVSSLYLLRNLVELSSTV